MENRDFVNEFLNEMENDNPFETESNLEAASTPTAEENTTQDAEAVQKPTEIIPQNLPKESVKTATVQPVDDDNENDDNDDNDNNNNETDDKQKESEQPEQQMLTGDPFEAAFKRSVAQCAQKSKERLIGSLAEKNPIFKYSSINDAITDKEITFEDLRKKYETDFPELEEKQNISWTVTYGKSSEAISNPNKDKVFEIKAKIEKSDKFIADLKKAKTNANGTKSEIWYESLDCVVKPFVKAQKKGDSLAMPDYKGFYMNYDEAMQSNKVITFVPARDGRVYEIRKNRIGTFQSPAKVIGELSDIKTEFVLSLPKIPMFLLHQVISFFREISKKHTLEVLVHLVYDTEAEKYNVIVPAQKVTNVSVDAESEVYPDNIIHVMDIHSHNVMAAKFSGIDDKDEKVTRLYGVIGKLDKFMPDIALRASNGGKFIELSPDEIFDYEATYPEEWFDSLDHKMAEAICFSEMRDLV